MDSEWFIISDLEDFIEKTRFLVYDNFGAASKEQQKELKLEPSNKGELEEINSILSYNESYSIVKAKIRKQKHKILKNKYRYLLSDKIFLDIISDLNTRMVSNILNNLVQKGLIESGFDSEANDFIFWIKEDAKKNEKEKPETD
jgi:hypothetical protein